MPSSSESECTYSASRFCEVPAWLVSWVRPSLTMSLNELAACWATCPAWSLATAATCWPCSTAVSLTWPACSLAVSLTWAADSLAVSATRRPWSAAVSLTSPAPVPVLLVPLVLLDPVSGSGA